MKKYKQSNRKISQVIRKEVGKSVEIFHPSTELEFDRVLTSVEGPFVVDFYAKWLTDAIKENGNHFKVIHVDVSKLPAIAKRFNIVKVPGLAGIDRDGNFNMNNLLVGPRSLKDVNEFLYKLNNPTNQTGIMYDDDSVTENESGSMLKLNCNNAYTDQRLNDNFFLESRQLNNTTSRKMRNSEFHHRLTIKRDQTDAPSAKNLMNTYIKFANQILNSKSF
ncbi:hypothetical protein GJ496_001543 [Pomphorhynchus laevis]|nr:hypothetical protein GJ496_001543 [Pomphorhynchus laevis]